MVGATEAEQITGEKAVRIAPRCPGGTFHLEVLVPSRQGGLRFSYCLPGASEVLNPVSGMWAGLQSGYGGQKLGWVEGSQAGVVLGSWVNGN